MTKQFREAQIEFYLFFSGVSLDYYLERSNKKKHWTLVRFEHAMFTSSVKFRAKRELTRPINEGEK